MKIKHLSKKIKGQPILDSLTFTLYPGQITGLIGRNGSGKTSLFRTIANHYQADQGDISLHEKKMSQHKDCYQKLFYLDMLEHPLANLTPKQIGRYYQLLYPTFDQKKYDSLLTSYQLPLKSRYRHYSKGTKSLLHVIIAFSTGAPYLLLDEPFDGIDIIIKKQVIQLIIDEVSQRQLAILISSHNLSELEMIIDRALILKDQHIVKDYQLDSVRETAVKIQMIFNTPDIPDLIRKNCTIISQQGRVVTGIFPNLSKDLLIQVKLLKPVLFEELPVTLEDLFTTNLVNDEDYQLTL